jgi:branched-chain amino acid transport system ATP-binding protein
MLVLHDVHVHYGKIHALKGVSLEVREGEIVTIIGANGAGKSTTLKVVSGLLRPTSGTISYDGERIDVMQPSDIVGLGLCHTPEGRRIFPELTVDENLSMGAYLRTDKDGIEADRTRVFEWFPILQERRTQHGGTLSGGEQQMLAIARSMMGRPKLLMLDEPSLGLAPIIVQQIFETIAALNREEGLTILLVEQNASLALRTAHRGYVYETGTVTMEDAASALAENEQVREAYLGSA